RLETRERRFRGVDCFRFYADAGKTRRVDLAEPRGTQERDGASIVDRCAMASAFFTDQEGGKIARAPIGAAPIEQRRGTRTEQQARHLRRIVETRLEPGGDAVVRGSAIALPVQRMAQYGMRAKHIIEFPRHCRGEPGDPGILDAYP